MAENQKCEERICRERGCLVTAIHLSEFCAEHLTLKGNDAVKSWQRKIMDNKESLKGGNFYLAPLKGAKLPGANFNEADLQHAFLEYAFLEQASFNNSNLQFANFENAMLFTANLEGSDLSFSNFRNADLACCNLSEANLKASNLENSDLSGANITCTSFESANLEKAKLDGVHYTESCRFPVYGQAVVLCLWLSFIDRKLWLLGGILRHFTEAVRGTDYFNIFFDCIKNYAVGRIREFKKRDIKWPIINILRKPTLWKSSAVENVGTCNSIFRRYIKDQSYLEARLARTRYGSWDRVWMFVWGITCGYGSNIWLWITWASLLAITFGMLYFLGDITGHNIVKVNVISRADPTWFTYIYFSVVTFTTLGFGDVTPTGTLGELIVMVEVILGYVMLGGLISILSTKLARLAG